MLAQPLSEYGLKLESFYVQSISLPEELQSQLDKVASMKIVGDLRQYAQFQAADSISTAAANEGGAAGAGASMGAGLAIGQAMSSAMSGGSASAGEDPVVMIGKLHDLLTKGVISQAEFDAKKAELLRKIS